MGLVYLTNGEMVETTSRWVGSERETFMAIAEIAPLMPRVDSAHQGLLALGKQGATTYAVVDNLEVLDGRHDHLLRAVYYMHRAYREYLMGQLLIDADAIQRVKDSQKAILPRGMTGVKQGYVQEAGNAKLAKQAIAKTPAATHVIAELRLTTNVGGQNVVDEWFAAAQALGAAAQAKSAVLEDTDPELGTKILKARQAWISIVRVVLGVLEHANAPVEKIAALRQPVDDIETRSTARAMGRVQAAPAAPTPPPA
jgi:hypothetical protein